MKRLSLKALFVVVCFGYASHAVSMEVQDSSVVASFKKLLEEAARNEARYEQMSVDAASGKASRMDVNALKNNIDASIQKIKDAFRSNPVLRDQTNLILNDIKERIKRLGMDFDRAGVAYRGDQSESNKRNLETAAFNRLAAIKQRNILQRLQGVQSDMPMQREVSARLMAPTASVVEPPKRAQSNFLGQVQHAPLLTQAEQPVQDLKYSQMQLQP